MRERERGGGGRRNVDSESYTVTVSGDGLLRCGGGTYS